MINSFDPIVDKNCHILILGTMPGVQSLLKQQYYGYKQNAFWKIMFGIFDEEPTDIYEDKKSFLLRRHIALWDVLKACDRKGSGDSEIQNPIPNDFETFFKKYPDISHIYFNGGNAEKFFKKFVNKNISSNGIQFQRLPSTSPAHAAAFEYKLNKWMVIKDDLSGMS